MKGRYCLGRLGNQQLLAALNALVRAENEVTSDLLAHLAELDERQLFLELGFPSLFAYCTESLGLSESSAGRRITAARVGRRFAGVFAAVARGELNLSILCALNPHLNLENAAELFGACGGKKRQQVEEILAARFPRPDVRESIRHLPVRAPGSATVAGGMVALPGAAARLADPDGVCADLHGISGEFTGNTASDTVPAATLPPAARHATSSHGTTRIEPLAADRYGVHFTADGEFRELLEAARALASHRLPAGNISELLKAALKAFIQSTEKKRFAVGRKPRRVRANDASSAVESGAHSPGERDGDPCSTQPIDGPATTTVNDRRGEHKSRHIPAAVAREVYVRDARRCSFVSADGRRCDSRVFLELDHEQPWAAGGAGTAANLRLRCRAHNLLHARRYFGNAYVAAAMKRRRTQIDEGESTHRD